MIDRAVDKHYRHYRQPLPPNDDGPVVKTQPDYALYNSGGRIIHYLTTPDYHRYKPSTVLGRFFKLQNWIPPPLAPGRERLANRAIQVGMQAGDCWPMQGSRGQIAIRLARRVVVTAVTIEHVDPRISLDLGSAPREVEIWRLAAPLATSTASPSAFIFTLFPHSARMTHIQQNAPAYGVLVRVLSNWGHPDFTCLYRVHVHGYEV
ncbi:MAG: UNC-like C-terminal-domain-containing protein [Linnemannia gamsii]|nr:MAG: UNC-like C-terminal-domain-containing protein [Linnemannia gamsii]